MTIDLDRFWDDADVEPKQPGIEKQDLLAWQRRQGVLLPRVLRAVLHRQNGGLVRNSTLRILPLDEMVPMDEEFWEYADHDEESIRDRDQVLMFARDDNGEPIYLMNFNAYGPHGEPTVHHFFGDGGEITDEAKTPLRFFTALTAVADGPALDWDETTRVDPVLHQEKIDLGLAHGGQPAFAEVVFGRLDGSLVLYTHEQTPNSDTFTKTTIPEQLDKSAASIDAYRPKPIKTHTLHVEPKDSEGIVSITSERMGDEGWKNTTDHGVPVYVAIESRSKETLQTLRETLFGKKMAKKAEQQERTQEEMMERFEALTDEQKQAAASAMTLRMLENSELGDLDIDEADLPPELRHIGTNMKKMAEGIKKKAQDSQRSNPADDEAAAVADLMAQMMREAEDVFAVDDDEEEEEERPRRKKKKR